MSFSQETLVSMAKVALANEEQITKEAIERVVQHIGMMGNIDEEQLRIALLANFDVVIGDASTLEDDGHIRWYEDTKPTLDFYYWKRYRELLQHQGLPSTVIAKMDQTTDKILGLIDDPNRPGNWDRKGLVLGHVQSGKTSNYLGLVNKAADAGYRVIIIIAGVQNSLRNQTQHRTDLGFVGLDSTNIGKSSGTKHIGVGLLNATRTAGSFTSTQGDFNKATANKVNFPLTNSNEPVVFVIKKNTNTLSTLIDWLQHHSGTGSAQRIDLPLLLIDDEADNASINTSKPGEVSRINKQIRELLGVFNRSAYIGYTATPFANIFIDPDNDDHLLGQDLFPRDFIVSLEAPNNYIGPGRVFTNEGAHSPVRYIDDHWDLIPSSHKKDLAPDLLPESLTTAIRAFILARAIRIKRGDGRHHSSMLVNPSPYVDVQDAVSDLVLEYVSNMQNSIRVYGGKTSEQSKRYPLFRDLFATWSEEFSDLDFSWDEIYPLLREAVEPVQVVNINSKSSGRLNYAEAQDSPLHVIAIGGYSLSRGLTLEGLTTSYIIRNSRSYDTLFQMGRWFGYRPNYEDICRIWMTEEMAGWYEHITEAVEELRSDLRRMEQAGARPIDFGLRVRSHPEFLMVTARNKMGTSETVTASLSLDGKAVETSRLSWKNDDLEANRKYAVQLAENLIKKQGRPTQIGGTYLWTDVDSESVEAFLNLWRNPPQAVNSDPDLVLKFIRARKDVLGLGTWDIAFTGRNSFASKNEKEPVNSTSIYPFELIMQNRSKGQNNSNLPGYIAVTDRNRVLSPSHEYLGLTPKVVNELKRETGSRGVNGLAIRGRRERPLLLVHTLQILESKNEAKLRANGVAQPISEEPVIAWTISFPAGKVPIPGVEYVANRQWLRDYHGGAADSIEDEEDLLEELRS